MLHIEITGDCSSREWEALAALVAVMRGAPGCDVHAEPRPEVPAVAGLPVMPEQGEDATKRTLSEAVAAGLLDPNAPSEAAMTATAAAVAAGVVLDAAGLPWDMRIHASTKNTNKDGTWKALRGVDAAMKAAVEAELRAVMTATPSNPATAAVPPPPPAPEDGPTVTDAAAAFPGNVAALPDTNATTAEPVPSGPDATNGASPSSFAEMMKLVVAKQAAGILTTEQTTTFAQALGLTKLSDLNARPDLIPAFVACLP